MALRAHRLLLCLLIASTGACLQSHAAEVEQPDLQLAEVNQAIAAIEGWMEEAAGSRSTLEQELRASGRQMDELRHTVEQQQQAIAAQTAQLEQLNNRRDTLQRQKAEQQALVSRALRASYMNGHHSNLKLLLNQEDPAPAARMMQYYAAFNADRLQRIAAFQQTLDELDATARQISSVTDELEASLQELQQRQEALEELRLDRQRILASLEAELVARSDEREELLGNRQHLQELIDEINRIVADIPPQPQMTPFADARGKLPWPLEGRLLTEFGATYSDGGLLRQGVILSADEGSPVQAVHPGRVVYADWLRGSGFLIVLDHGQGYMSLYAQNSELLRANGDYVSRGGVIARAGANAGTGRPGIYFEIRHNGQAQNPVNWCVRR